ncbi:DNA replication licencing factor MCM5 [Carpediemonas membranifera]|uniref:DNA helicase n=1 Tax=Carpediemonas membranifera TaxID=201153 RepID=A0A8J6BCE6_9EUKA|nr:DNA replication licencing factor MCM5 [Carpediemonas membranifera]|eukprot:KAG9394497.1 DNA replication licencing factor MCM5 [Carpediemonas membranifera]
MEATDEIQETVNAQVDMTEKMCGFIRSTKECYNGLQENIQNDLYCLNINYEDLKAEGYDDIVQYVRNSPMKALEIMETAARIVANEMQQATTGLTIAQHLEIGRPIQVILNSDPIHGYTDEHEQDEAIRLSELNVSQLQKLVVVRAIVIACMPPHYKVTKAVAKCRRCGHELTMDMGWNTPTQLPAKCQQTTAQNTGLGPTGTANNCGANPYELLEGKCQYVAVQHLKLQELPEHGSEVMPQTKQAVVDRNMVDAIQVGSRIRAMCTYTAQEYGKKASVQAVSQPVLRIFGAVEDELSVPRSLSADNNSDPWTLLDEAGEEHPIEYLAKHVIAPEISGHLNIKKAIAAFLFGGTRIEQPSITVRGDIHVLLMGDPGTAKSQFLKWTQKVAPISVYSSGKGSSAAGLTAAVRRDGGGEWYLEGGAMVRGDGGVVCIDEFDKMDEGDRVAIHEAMEQQTISINKANISAMLNSRCGVLAAANPIFGSIREDESMGDQIEFQTTILSRFDMIFMIRDTVNEAQDREIGMKLVEKHFGNPNAEEADSEQIHKLTRYIAEAKRIPAPLTADSGRILQENWIRMRGEGTSTKVKLTARQLEAMFRIASACARMRKSDSISEADAKIAVDLFTNSTMHVAKEGGVAIEGMTGSAGAAEVQVIREWILNSLVRQRRRAELEAELIANFADKDMGKTEAERVVRSVLSLMMKAGEITSFKADGNEIVRKRH